MIHANSTASYWHFDKNTRRDAVLEAITGAGRPVTDRQICESLGSADMNYARPTITRLVDDGVLRECGNIRCPVTGRTVRLVYFEDHQ